MFCQYRELLGRPREGLHAYRFYDFAIVDIMLTFLGAWIISYFTKWPYHYTLPSLFLTGIVLHRLFCVQTTLDRLIGVYL